MTRLNSWGNYEHEDRGDGGQCEAFSGMRVMIWIRHWCLPRKPLLCTPGELFAELLFFHVMLMGVN